MAGLPKLPGLTFTDPTNSRFHRSQTFNICNGYKVPKQDFVGIGGQELESNTVKYLSAYDPVRFDPSLIYGRTRSVALPQFIPHYALYDQKCLTFKAYFKQAVTDSPLEFYRVRQVNIIYFLEDDTITIMEPRVLNSGLEQGRLVRRDKIPKTALGDYWHWKDLAIGKDLCIYGIVYHTVDCDTFTREYMASQGLTMGDAEAMPPDPYIQDRQFQERQHTTQTPPADDKLRRFLEYDGKILKFYALWDDRDTEYGELRKYEILYFLADDTVSVKEVHFRNDGRDPYPQLLKKTKLPKIWTDQPVTFPSVYLELSDAEVTEYYQPKDFMVGETVYVLGRKMLLYDCDEFTKNYYRKVLCKEQKPAIEVDPKPKPPPEKTMPPHDGLGSLEDSLQNTISFVLKPPKKDVIRQILNVGKNLRYEMMFDVVHPEDSIRRFILMYSLSDGTCYVYEPRIRNSGIIGGKYLKNTLIAKPGSDPINPNYYTPADFYIGAIITIFEQRFRIIGADLYVYRYMQANPEKFPCEVIENMRNYMFNKGFLKDDIEDKIEEICEKEKKIKRDAIGKELEYTKTEMEKCLEAMNVRGDESEEDKAKRRLILQQYEDSLKPTYTIPPHGIVPVQTDCAYPIRIGDVKSSECIDDPNAEGQSLTPKHIDTPEEIQQKYYAEVLRQQHEVCEHGKPVECFDAPNEFLSSEEKVHEHPEPIMVVKPEMPKGACRVKTVQFAEGPERCDRDRYDLCDLKTHKDHCDCTNYKK